MFEIADQNGQIATGIDVLARAAVGELEAGKATIQEFRTGTIGLGTVAPATDSGILLTSASGVSITASGVVTEGADRTRRASESAILSALETVSRLKPVSYTDVATGRPGLGFIAQDLREILPDIVYGEEGSLSISYSSIVALLTRAVQQQQEAIASMSAGLSDVTVAVDSLRGLDSRLADLETTQRIASATPEIVTGIVLPTPTVTPAPVPAPVYAYRSTSSDLPAGTLVRLATASGETRVEPAAGAYSTDFLGTVTQSSGSGVAIASDGETTVSVTGINGPVRKGDYLAVSDIPGLAMKSTQAGMAVGIALSDFAPDGLTPEPLPEAEVLSTQASASALTQSQLVEVLKARLSTLTARYRDTRGTVRVLLRPAFTLPKPDCPLTDMYCRSDYFALLFSPEDLVTLAPPASGFDGYVESSVIERLAVKQLEVESIELPGNAGTAVIGAGSRELTVNASAVGERSIIQITFEADYAPATRYFIGRKVPGEGFTVTLDQPVARDVPFSWWIVQNNAPTTEPTRPQSTVTPVLPQLLPTVPPASGSALPATPSATVAPVYPSSAAIPTPIPVYDPVPASGPLGGTGIVSPLP
ncbi:hypothetical protein A2Z33_00735 [Candidatus Gottesmanbacteria bacterium RBG_16_52_11]|uniref:Peptidase S74 domain-containing protein n=1 Tax=Candidatus Gottesmanbacteria bacterium RBG_16_52_11 TaxID=1798374 RepID=A0A1F5YV83_9BACT|nr:MAG: hypothetical protein A2Z33_00735 [Candidatus Gottesmanbacteria bacterium RBG_16_52_11]